MKILRVITSTAPTNGGPIEGIKQVSRVLASQGHRTDVACLDAPDAPWLKALPFKTYALGPGRFGYQYSKYFVPWLRQNAAKYDYVIVHGIWQYSSFGVWLALQRPLNAEPRQPYFVYTHGMLDPWFKRTYPLKHLKKWLYWPWAEYRVLRDAQAVLFTCEEERVLARQSFRLYTCNEVVVNYGTAKPEGDPAVQHHAFLNQFPELRDKRLVLFLSRIHPKKGCDLLIEAFAQLIQDQSAIQHSPETDQLPLHLVIAGPDQTGWQNQLQQQSKQLGISDRITWTGMLSGDLKWGAFHAAEVFVLPSHQENFGIVVAEALACGLPVLISNKVNIWREIAADGAGLVANDTLAGTSKLLRQWLVMPLEAKQAMRRKAQQSFNQRFNIQSTAASFIQAVQNH